MHEKAYDERLYKICEKRDAQDAQGSKRCGPHGTQGADSEASEGTHVKGDTMDTSTTREL